MILSFTLVLACNNTSPSECIEAAEQAWPPLRWGTGDEAQLVDDQQAEGGKLPLQVEQPSLVPGLHQRW